MIAMPARGAGRRTVTVPQARSPTSFPVVIVAFCKEIARNRLAHRVNTGMCISRSISPVCRTDIPKVLSSGMSGLVGSRRPDATFRQAKTVDCG